MNNEILYKDLNTNKDNYLLFIFLNLITNYKDKFYNGADTILPEIFAEMVTLSEQPNCSCRSKVTNFVSVNAERVNNYINSWIHENLNQDLDSFLKALAEQLSSESVAHYFKGLNLEGENVDLAGQIITISGDEKEYFKVLRYLKTKNISYKGLNMFNYIDEEENSFIRIYFY